MLRRGLALSFLLALAVALTGCFGSSTTLKQDGQTAPKIGARGLHGQHVLFRGTDHCFVPPGQGRPGICEKQVPGPKPPAAFGEPGADVSNYQKCVSGAGLAFIIAKTGEGPAGRFHDAYGACTWHSAQSRGVVAGNYWFGRNCGDARTQARYFAQWTAGERSSLPGALDYETNDCGLSNQTECNWIRDFGDEYLKQTGYTEYIVYDAPGLWPGCDSIPHGRGWVASLGNNCSAVLSGFGGRMTICQWTFTGPFGGDGDRWWKDSPGDLVRSSHGPPPPPPIPAEVRALKDQIVTLWDRRAHYPLSSADRKTYDADMNRIYFLGWQPHRSAPSHDWTFKPGATERRKGDIVRAHWKKGKHGRYVHRLLDENWRSSHTRDHRYGDVRMPGFYKIHG